MKVKIFVDIKSTLKGVMDRITIHLNMEIVDSREKADLVVVKDYSDIGSSFDPEKWYAAIDTEKTKIILPSNIRIFKVGFSVMEYYLYVQEISDSLGHRSAPVSKEMHMDFPKGYVAIDTAPEGTIISVLWGDWKKRHEYGKAIRHGKTWYIKSERNPHANGRECATPTLWHP